MGGGLSSPVICNNRRQAVKTTTIFICCKNRSFAVHLCFFTQIKKLEISKNVSDFIATALLCCSCLAVWINHMHFTGAWAGVNSRKWQDCMLPYGHISSMGSLTVVWKQEIGNKQRWAGNEQKDPCDSMVEFQQKLLRVYFRDAFTCGSLLNGSSPRGHSAHEYWGLRNRSFFTLLVLMCYGSRRCK